MSDARQAILADIQRRRGRTGSPGDIAAELEALPQVPEPPLDSEDLLECFLAKLAQAKASLEIASDRGAVVKAISSFLYRRHNSRRLVAGHDPRLAALPWRDGGVLVRFDAATPEDIVSVSYAELGVAESGSLLLYSDRNNPARNNWVVQEQIIVLDLDDLVPGLEQAWARISADRDAGNCPRGTHFISGPSSTGDIVGHLVVGAHGPQCLHVILRGHVDPARLQALDAYLTPA